MKKLLKSISVLGLFSTLMFTSCQTEENVVIDSPQNLTKIAPLTMLISRVAQSSTSQDNVLDSSSCFNVNLPATVFVNGQQVVVETAADYAIVQNILNEFNEDDDSLTFVYPITITYANYSTQIIANADQLENVIDGCGEDNDIDEIECLLINYPITISFYDAANQTPSSITINNDAELYNFFNDFDDDDYAQINYPIAVTTSNGQQTTISNNDQLEDAIEAAEDTCNNDEDVDDDDNDDSDNTPISPNFTAALTAGSWSVTYFFDEVNETANYTNYAFTFNVNGSINVIGNGLNLSGVWSAYVDDNENTLELDFSASQLEELGDDWEIIEYTPTLIRLKDVSGENGEVDYLTFTKN
ncbi:hypothetical protein [Flavobacterium sp.]|uniref:hypothetical protein n=1 Tax=Flavobacterium sp. TaxID=239 RepID=UPI002B4B0D4D|nr:hypothetical protein [Flavobacterium sp.]HLF52163.1 hypothetical protein [Flavobacterium sp.]